MLDSQSGLSGSKPLGDFKVDSVFHHFKVDEMYTIKKGHKVLFFLKKKVFLKH